MTTTEEQIAEQDQVRYIKPVADTNCDCKEQKKLDAALAGIRANPEIFAPENVPEENAYCATHDKQCDGE